MSINLFYLNVIIVQNLLRKVLKNLFQNYKSQLLFALYNCSNIISKVLRIFWLALVHFDSRINFFFFISIAFLYNS